MIKIFWYASRNAMREGIYRQRFSADTNSKTKAIQAARDYVGPRGVLVAYADTELGNITWSLVFRLDKDKTMWAGEDYLKRLAKRWSRAIPDATLDHLYTDEEGYPCYAWQGFTSKEQARINSTTVFREFPELESISLCEDTIIEGKYDTVLIDMLSKPVPKPKRKKSTKVVRKEKAVC